LQIRSARNPLKGGAVLAEEPGVAEDLTPVAPLLLEMDRIRSDLLRLEKEFERQLLETHRAYQQSARNLVHYLALRQRDIRELQDKLAALGLSSLGRTESHVLAGVDAVRKVIARLSDQPCAPLGTYGEPIRFMTGRELLRAHTEALLGPRPGGRGVRIMVTMPSETADDYELVKQLLARGVDCVRITAPMTIAGRGAEWSRMSGGRGTRSGVRVAC
jgi:pyruvate kinase